ncbi:hypothetical protein [uncultured Phyllobacterium sp.]|uniref:hypothetical protein n=1 Tax=uncultured Phyllobacterium sp. TaxID=253813 RepID=UPI002589BA23|nr:hypothetical protein [uncultured Phyllobacterium sp.]
MTIKTSSLDTPFRICSWLCALVIVVLAVFQAMVAYNPVPVWDMQEGYLGFLEKLQNGDWGAWIAPHYEHRILLQRIIFWFDNYIFGGVSIFAIVANFICISCNVALLYLLAKRRNASSLPLALIICWCFLLVQGENITWAFQAQFHLAYLVPLAGLYLIAVERKDLNWLRCLGAVGAGLLSIGTMGNGILALPLYVAYAIVMRFPARLTSIFLGGLTLEVLFLLSNHSPGTAQLNLDLLTNLDTILLFLLRLLGSPFYHLLGSSDRFHQVEIIGLVYLLLLSTKTIQLLRQKSSAPVDWALATFALYVVLSYAGASVSRSNVGMALAVTTHYTTPSLLGWMALAILHFDCFQQQLSAAWRFIAFFVFSLVIVTYQYSALGYFSGPLFDWKVATLGLALGADDQIAQRRLAAPESYREIKRYSEPAYQSNFSYFQSIPFSGIREQLGQISAENKQPNLQGCSIAPFQMMTTTDPKFFRFSSFIELDAARSNTYPDFVRILDEKNRQLGFALVQSGWRDRREITPVNGKYRFKVEGYVASSIGRHIDIVAEAGGKQVCNVSTEIPSQPMQLKIPFAYGSSGDLPIAQVSNVKDITGGDGLQTNLCSYGLQVLGTFGPDGDATKAALRFQLRSGQSFLYRSGPTAGNQRLSIVDGSQFLMPQALDWLEVTLDPSLYGNKDSIDVSVLDEGSGWGEWSAIAVRVPVDQCRPPHKE